MEKYDDYLSLQGRDSLLGSAAFASSALFWGCLSIGMFVCRKRISKTLDEVRRPDKD
jgi:hypothetical protein